MGGAFLVNSIVIVVYLAAMTWLGLWFGRGQKNARDYFVSESEIPSWAVLFSIVATETSALTFISVPGLAYIGNLTFLQIILGYILGRIVIAYTLLPQYIEGRASTAYVLLEKRFGTRMRRYASVVFMFTRAAADSVRLFATAIPVALIMKPWLPATWTPAMVSEISILVLGIVTAFYTYHGGVRAVVWTDFVQTMVYLTGGLIALGVLAHLVPGGWPVILAHAHSAGKLRVFDFSLGLDRPFTFFAGVIGGTFLTMATHGVDQLIVQRLLTAKGLRQARVALVGSGFVVFAQMLLFLLIGSGLYAFYQAKAFAAPDSIFPQFIMDHMPVGITGLVVAAIMAATMSAHSGALNSMAASTIHDLYLPLSRRPLSEKQLLKLSRWVTAFWAFVLVGAAMMYPSGNTPIVTVALQIASFTFGGLLGAFCLGHFTKRVTENQAIFGMSFGITAMIAVVFAKQLGIHALSGIAWPWYVLIGTSMTVLAGGTSFWVMQFFVRISASRPEPVLVEAAIEPRALSRAFDQSERDSRSVDL